MHNETHGFARSFVERSLLAAAWLMTATSVSMDELVVDFGLGLLGVSIPLAAAYIVAQALLVTWIGTALGVRVGEGLAERAEVVGGIVLRLLAVSLATERALGMT